MHLGFFFTEQGVNSLFELILMAWSVIGGDIWRKSKVCSLLDLVGGGPGLCSV